MIDPTLFTPSHAAMQMLHQLGATGAEAFKLSEQGKPSQAVVCIRTLRGSLDAFSLALDDWEGAELARATAAVEEKRGRSVP